MSRGLVSTRPFPKKRKAYSLKRAIGKTGIPLPSFSFTITQKAKSLLTRAVICSILCILGFIFLIKGIFFKEEFRMETVKWSDHTIETFEDMDLFNLIAQKIKGQNYYLLNSTKKGEILSQVQKQFPFVKGIHFQLETGHALGVDLDFIQPFFKVKLGEKQFWIWWENAFFEIQSGMALWMESSIIDTPQYLSGIQNLNGFFFEMTVADFQHIVPLIQEQIPNMTRFVYLAGSTRLAIFTANDQVLYFTFRGPESLQEQFEKYQNLKTNYPEFNKLTSIDLGSLDTTKIIVRKKS